MWKIFVVALALFAIYIILDFLWFTLMGNFFKGEIGNIARLTTNGTWDVRIIPALLVYVFMTAGLMIFVLPNAETLGEVAIFAALFGLITYGVYDLTNMATLSAWTYRFALVDMAWGTALNAIVAVSGKQLMKMLF